MPSEPWAEAATGLLGLAAILGIISFATSVGVVGILEYRAFGLVGFPIALFAGGVVLAAIGVCLAVIGERRGI